MRDKLSNASDFETSLKDALYCYNEYDYANSLLKVNELLKINKKDFRCRSLKASILIESWDGTKSTQSQIMEALSHLEWLLKEDPSDRARYLGHKGNAFMVLADNELRKSGPSFKLNNEIIEDLIKSKNCYHESLKIDENQPAIWVNRGNVLDYLGRHLEAIECYDMAILIDNKHYNAWGNRGITCWRLSDMVTHKGDKRLLISNAMKYLGVELVLYPDFDIDKKIKKMVEKFVEENEIRPNVDRIIKEQLPKRLPLVSEDFNLHGKMEGSFKEFYDNFCDIEGLFLNSRFDCNNCRLNRLDMLDFPVSQEMGDYEASYKLVKKLNNLVDEYKTARFFLALAQYRNGDFLFLDDHRSESDHSLSYMVNVEILKEAFIKIMNIFDKIAFFLVDYEELTRHDASILDDKNISFWNPNSIFTQTDILKKNDYQKDLVAIDSIRRDLEKDEFKDIRITRDVLVHRYFVLHDVNDCKVLTYPNDPQKRPLNDLNYHGTINQFYLVSKKSLRLIRNILFSLSFFINQKENPGMRQ